MRYSKPDGFPGRGKGTKSYKKNKWEANVFDKETNTFRTGQYPTKEQLINGLELTISPDQLYRLYSGHRVDTSKTKKDSSFLNRHGHIQIKKLI